MKLKLSFFTYGLQTAHKRGVITKQNKPGVRLKLMMKRPCICTATF